MKIKFDRFSKSRPKADETLASGLVTSDRSTMDLVHKVMQKTNTHEDPAGGEPITRRETQRDKLAKARKQRQEKQQATESSDSGGLIARLIEQIKGYRPTPAHMTIVVCALIFVLQPWLMPVLAIGALIAAVASLAILGKVQVLQRVYAGYEWLAQRNPDNAEAIKANGLKVSGRLEKLIDKLPERWTKGRAAPIVEPSEFASEKMSADPFERLAAQARNM